MRTKSEARRDGILNIALEVFREVGFEAASMSQIAARVGGSKSTLYNYFSSKEELLLEGMLSSADRHAQSIRQLLKTSVDFSSQLLSFTEALLKLINSPETTQILRVAISVGGTTDIGRHFYELGTHDVWLEIADLLRKEIEKGNLRNTDPDMMAMHLRCLCEAELIRNLLGVENPSSDKETKRKAQYIVNTFLNAYSTGPRTKAPI